MKVNYFIYATIDASAMPNLTEKHPITIDLEHPV